MTEVLLSAKFNNFFFVFIFIWTGCLMEGGGVGGLVNELAQDPHEASRTASEPRDIFSLAISKSSKSNFFLGVWGSWVVEGEMGLEGEVEGAMAWKH
jgi:hypothetical protein